MPSEGLLVGMGLAVSFPQKREGGGESEEETAETYYRFLLLNVGFPPLWSDCS